jgi:hypothetical protein
MKQYRLNRLLNAKSSPCFDVAVDHGFFNQPNFLSGIEDMRKVVRTLMDAAPGKAARKRCWRDCWNSLRARVSLRRLRRRCRMRLDCSTRYLRFHKFKTSDVSGFTWQGSDLSFSEDLSETWCCRFFCTHFLKASRVLPVQSTLGNRRVDELIQH